MLFIEMIVVQCAAADATRISSHWHCVSSDVSYIRVLELEPRESRGPSHVMSSWRGAARRVEKQKQMQMQEAATSSFALDHI